MLVSAACLSTRGNSHAAAPGGAAMYSLVLQPSSECLCTHTIDPLINKTPHFIPQRRKQPPWDSSPGHSTTTQLRFSYMPYYAQQSPLDHCLSRKACRPVPQWGNQPCQGCPCKCCTLRSRSASITCLTTCSQDNIIAPPKLIFSLHAPHWYTNLLHSLS